MTTGIEKFKLEERVRLTYLKHRGDILKVAEELELPLEYVRKIGDKIKKKCRRDVAYLVSTTMMEQLILGHSQRIQYLVECLDSLKDKEEAVQSLCCKAPVEMRIVRRWKEEFFCLDCGKICFVKIVTKTSIYDLKYKAIEMLREEDVALVTFAEKMGYTDKKPDNIYRVTQNVAIIGDTTDKDKQIVRDLRDLSPRDRQKIRKSIEQKVFEEGEK